MNRRIISGAVLILAIVFSCDNSDDAIVSSDLTGVSTTYSLQQASLWNINGTAIFSEKKDGSTLIQIKLDGIGDTQGNSELPVHLHLGNISTDQAEIAALLNPVNIKTGASETSLTLLANETNISYAALKEMDACIKIHLSSFGEGKDVVLAAGNIGAAVAGPLAGGRIKVGTCKSE
jgi:hypothetical protein